jgi:hypothetical protein
VDWLEAAPVIRYRTARRDANHAAIVAGLRAAGCSVLELHAVGGGCPDLLVGAKSWDYLLEIKRPGWQRYAKSGTAPATLKRQADFRASWRGHPVAVVETLDQALAAVGLAA